MNYNWIYTHEIQTLANKKLVLFGAGKGSEEFLSFVEKLNLKVQILCITDNHPCYWGRSFLHYPILPPSEIGSLLFDKIVVTSVSGRETIAIQLENAGYRLGLDFILIGKYPRTFLNNFHLLINSFKNKGFSIEEVHALNIGPGGFLGFEALLYCFGASKVHAIDKFGFGIHYPDISLVLEDYLSIPDCFDKLCDKTCGKTDLHEKNARFENLFIKHGAQVLLDTQKISYSNMDVCALTFPDQSFDLVTSFAVLEHVHSPENAVREIIRVLKPGAYGFHTIVTRDHRSFSALDGFGPFTFRVHTDNDWEMLTLKQFYQNRLLPVQWRSLFAENGCDIIDFVVNKSIDITSDIARQFDNSFHRFSYEELGQIDCSILIRKKII